MYNKRFKNSEDVSEMRDDGMKKVGDILNQRRKEMNLSLKEAESATSIRLSYLQAIEEGEPDKLISPIYAQGFVRQYAHFLGLDGDQFVREHPEIFNRPPPHDFAYGIGTLEMRGNPGSGVRWIPNAMWIGAFVAIVLVGWYLARYLEVI